MAKFKVHKLAGAVFGVDGQPDRELALCKTTHRALLPLQTTDTWRAVTCDKCNRHRPARTLRERLLGDWWQRMVGRVSK
jgi:hypothetical protein